jgi:hypothetical protein
MASTIGTVMMKMAAPGSLGGSALNGPSGVSTGGADKKVKEQVSVLGDIRKHAADFNKNMAGQPRWWTKALKTMGIQMGIAGILKQSQIFTSTLGSLFQILGAFVDVMLAPWIPVIVPGLRKLADQVPRMRVAAQKFFEWATGSAWPWIKKIYNFLTNDLFNPGWWTGWAGTVLGNMWTDMKIWGFEQLSSVWEFLPGWMKGDTNPFTAKLEALTGGQTDNTSAVETGGKNATGGMGKIETALVTLAAVWATAKTLRYGLQAARWLPFINAITEPIRLVSKATDLLFNRTAQVLGRSIGGLTKTLLEGLGLKKPPVPKVTVTDPVLGSRGGPGGRGGTGGRGSAGRGGPPGGRGGVGAWDEGFDMIDWQRSGPGARTPVSSGASTVTKPTNTKLTRATTAFKKFKDWFWPALGELQKIAMKGGKGLQPLVQTGMGLARSMLSTAAGTSMAQAAARIAARFVKIIPFLGAAYMGAETTFDLKAIAQSEKGWTGDLSSASAWLTEGKGVLAGFLGGGTGFFSNLNPLKHARKLFEQLPGGAGDWFKDRGITLDQWKQMQGEEGALSGGKALDFGMRAVTGYGGAAASFLPLLGQLAGGALYEAGAYKSMGQFMGLDSTGQRKYGENDMASAAFEQLLKVFGGSEITLNVDGMPATIAAHP